MDQPTNQDRVEVACGACGTVATEWKYWHPGWQMTRFAPPPRR